MSHPLPYFRTLYAVFAELRALPPPLWLRGLPLVALQFTDALLPASPRGGKWLHDLVVVLLTAAAMAILSIPTFAQVLRGEGWHFRSWWGPAQNRYFVRFLATFLAALAAFSLVSALLTRALNVWAADVLWVPLPGVLVIAAPSLLLIGRLGLALPGSLAGPGHGLGAAWRASRGLYGRLALLLLTLLALFAAGLLVMRVIWQPFLGLGPVTPPFFVGSNAVLFVFFAFAATVLLALAFKAAVRRGGKTA